MGAPTRRIRDLNRPREEAAARELGRTRVSRSTALALTGAFAISLVSVPALEGVLDPPADSERAGASAPGPGWHALLTRIPTECAIDAFEERLEEASRVGHRIRPPLQQALSAWLGAGTEEVLPGRGGWLFHRPSVDYLTGPPFLDPEVQRARVRGAGACADPPSPDPVAAIRQLHDDLADRGIALVVVPTPVKGVLHPEQLASIRPGGATPVQNPSFAPFVDALEALGVAVFDPAPVLRDWREGQGGQPAYLAADTHWRAEAVDAVARALARFVEGVVDLSASPRLRLIRRAMRVVNRGDIARMLDLPPGSALYPAERLAIRQVQTESGAPYSPTSPAPVLLLGDSFSNIYSSREAFADGDPASGLDWGEAAGLAEQLAFHLRRPVDRIVRNAGGAHTTRRDLVQSLYRAQAGGRDRLRGVRVVVYQFAVRELSSGDWKPLPLPSPLEAGRAEAPPPGLARAARIQGTIAARSRVPAPRSVPYRDAVFALLLRGLALPEGAPPGRAQEEVVVYLLGMRDDVWTPAAGLRVGERVALRLEPWDDPEIQERYGSLNRTELDAPELLGLPAFWGELAAGPGGEGSADARRARFAELSGTERGTPPPVVRGARGWLLLGSELRHLSVGRFWGERAAVVSRAARREWADPLPAILDLHTQLLERGIELLFVPVPAKVVVHPEALPGPLARADPAGGRLDPDDRDFYDVLRERGVEVLDLLPAFAAARAEEPRPLYCRQDSHWSGAGCERAAARIAAWIRSRPWVDAVPKRAFETELREIEIAGDLWRMLGDGDLARERISLRFVGERGPTGLSRVEPWRESPVLLLGDSHNLVFHAAGDDMHARGAGLADHLARELGFPVDVVAVRGSGATPSRMSLLRRPGGLEGKRLVVWCLSVREFTESAQGWRPLPVSR